MSIPTPRQAWALVRFNLEAGMGALLVGAAVLVMLRLIPPLVAPQWAADDAVPVFQSVVACLVFAVVVPFLLREREDARLMLTLPVSAGWTQLVKWLTATVLVAALVLLAVLLTPQLHDADLFRLFALAVGAVTVLANATGVVVRRPVPRLALMVAWAAAAAAPAQFLLGTARFLVPLSFLAAAAAFTLLATERLQATVRRQWIVAGLLAWTLLPTALLAGNRAGPRLLGPSDPDWGRAAGDGSLTIWRKSKVFRNLRKGLRVEGTGPSRSVSLAAPLENENSVASASVDWILWNREPNGLRREGRDGSSLDFRSSSRLIRDEVTREEYVLSSNREREGVLTAVSLADPSVVHQAEIGKAAVHDALHGDARLIFHVFEDGAMLVGPLDPNRGAPLYVAPGLQPRTVPSLGRLSTSPRWPFMEAVPGGRLSVWEGDLVWLLDPRRDEAVELGVVAHVHPEVDPNAIACRLRDGTVVRQVLGAGLDLQSETLVVPEDVLTQGSRRAHWVDEEGALRCPVAPERVLAHLGPLDERRWTHVEPSFVVIIRADSAVVVDVAAVQTWTLPPPPIDVLDADRPGERWQAVVHDPIRRHLSLVELDPARLSPFEIAVADLDAGTWTMRQADSVPTWRVRP